MNTQIVRPEIGQWYARGDKGENFQVVGYDDHARTIEIQSFDGDIDEIDIDAWDSLALESSVAPEDCTGPMDEVEPDDLGYSETAMRAQDWARPLQPLRAGKEAWEESEAEYDGVPAGALTAQGSWIERT